jgi:primosomal protein N' (replication factor Y)
MGVLVQLAQHSEVPETKLRRAQAVIDNEPAFDDKLLALLLWAADYYRHPLGEVLAAALPGALGKGAELRATSEHWRLTELGRTEARATTSKRATRLLAVLDALEQRDSLDADALSHVHADWRAMLRKLHERQYVERFEVSANSLLAGATQPSSQLPDLSAQQQAALNAIVHAFGHFRTLLLHGVTGSGKTEVYLRAIAQVLARGEQALVLAPEIALTPQLLERFRTRFIVPIAVLHSGLNDSERLAAWRAARSGEAGIVIGTRSAVFTPLSRLGLIIVDEEHDASYKQQEGFRYSARDLSIVRAQRHGIPVVLGSATPALESLQRAQRHPEDLLVLPKRAGNALPPTLKLVDLRQHAANQGLSTPVMQSIRQHLDAQGQVLLYLNRRGYAPVLFCPSCGTVSTLRCAAHSASPPSQIAMPSLWP